MATSSTSFNSAINYVKNKYYQCARSLGITRYDVLNTIKEISKVVMLICGTTILIGLPFAYLLKHSTVVIGHPLFIFAGLIMQNPIVKIVSIAGFIISSIGLIVTSIIENRI